MAVATETRLDIVRLAPCIGAEVRGIDLHQPQDAATIAAIRKAWLDNIVLVFRGQNLTQDDHLRVTGWFGEIGEIARPKDLRPAGYQRLLDNIMLISNIRENGEPIGALPDGEMMFHHDMMHAAVPHNATLLYSIEVPSTGGDTLFANGYAAYETLDPAVRAKLEGRRSMCHYHYGSTQRGDDRGVTAFGQSQHPVFRTHDETGRKAIYVNRLMTVGVAGMDKAESDRLLNAVFDHAEKPQFVYAHKWRKGDLLIWDNRCSMHARTDFATTERRLLHRTTVKGTKAPY